MTILLVGANGQVGQELRQTLGALVKKTDASDTAFQSLTAVSRAELDLTDLDAIAQKVRTLSPTLIVNAAAYTAVDKAESEPELAHRINAEAPKALALAAAECGAAILHISTDYVFAGDDSSPRVETDATGPISVYGKTKLAGEDAIREVLDNHVILRTAWVYGCYGKSNFVKTMLRLAAERQQLSVVNDQIGSPTWAKDIADAIAHLSPLIRQQSGNYHGTYHFTNSGTASWHEFAKTIFQEARSIGVPLAIETLNAIPTADYPTPASRPAYSVMNCQKITDVLGYAPPTWQDSLKQMLQQYVQMNNLVPTASVKSTVQ
ncbi:MAG: dTDP-4-dehydrorhamnose reductase [Cyanobacteria bacterium J06649_4]